jgi:hypothetical protein
MSALAKSADRRVRGFGPDGVLWRRRFTLEKAEQHVKFKRAVAQRNSRGIITSIHFYGESRRPLSAKFKPGTRYSYQETVGCRRRWTHRNLPSVSVPAGLMESELVEHVDQARRTAFQGVISSVLVEAPETKELAQAA